ncbi:rRNA maturation RNase YbeY [Marinirhabdus gelatinilytica]|uniref:Endoribonuclease YbeY n=1 Tax=Marinirhabdus gelatinilytica TaxID=1703343 RepID=A0A370QK98_9FLAO|nr:rRNA maturation RNase YbeY [Marinirhabdus gelatinilytica]RDK88490.1 rRNA maturation RNase YbeY [Marinirhabdus gelatinilytica]
MIEFYSENNFKLNNTAEVSNWISSQISQRGFEEGELVFIFCDDDYLHKLNVQFLDHDTLTDIITFDNSLGKLINGEIYISTERVSENATEFDTDFTTELHRVLIHGILHLCGFKDKTTGESKAMRNAENEALNNRNFV